MLIIREQQVDSLQRGMNYDFARENCPATRNKYPEETSVFDDEELIEYIAETIARAQEYGLSTDNELVTFLHLTLAVAPEFDTKGVFRETFTDNAIAADERLNEVFNRATEEDWLEAARRN